VTQRRPRPWLALAVGGAGLAVAVFLVVAGIELRPCLHAVAPAAAAEPVTFSNQIARLFQDHCQGCHREGEIGGFSLATHADARRRRDKIWRMVEDRTLPPWKPVPDFGDFTGSRRSTTTPRATAATRPARPETSAGGRARPTRCASRSCRSPRTPSAWAIARSDPARRDAPDA
jgi:hypothetical protein